MGAAKRKRLAMSHSGWPRESSFPGTIDLHMLPPVAAINGARIRELTGDVTFPEAAQIVVQAFRAVVGGRTFHVGFCLGNDRGFSAIGIAVIERLMIETGRARLHVVPAVHQDVAWDIVVRHLRTFTGQALLFSFPDSETYDAGKAETHYSSAIRQFDHEGNLMPRLSSAQRQAIRARKAELLGQPIPKFYATTDVHKEDTHWIFRFVTPAGKVIRTAVWNGRRDYGHEMPESIASWVGGDKIAIVQVDSPVGINRRSSVDLTHKFAKEFDGVIHWARDTETFQSILNSFIRLDLESVSPPELPVEWKPEITIFAAKGD